MKIGGLITFLLDIFAAMISYFYFKSIFWAIICFIFGRVRRGRRCPRQRQWLQAAAGLALHGLRNWIWPAVVHPETPFFIVLVRKGERDGGEIVPSV